MTVRATLHCCSVCLGLKSLKAAWLYSIIGPAGVSRYRGSSPYCIIAVFPMRETINLAYKHSGLKSQLCIFFFFCPHPSLSHIHTLGIYHLHCNCLRWLHLSPELRSMNHFPVPRRQVLAPRWSFASEKSSCGFVWASSQPASRRWPSNTCTQTGNLRLHEPPSPVILSSPRL